MVHQCSLCYKDLTLRHFVVSSISDKLEKCVHGVVLCLICRNLYWTESIRVRSFLFPFEENYCRTIPITSRSLWWTCSIVRYVRTKISAFQEWCFQCCRQRLWKTATKFIALKLQASLNEDYSQTKTTRQAIGLWSTSYFQSTARDEKDSKNRKMGTTWV